MCLNLRACLCATPFPIDPDWQKGVFASETWQETPFAIFSLVSSRASLHFNICESDLTWASSLRVCGTQQWSDPYFIFHTCQNCCARASSQMIDSAYLHTNAKKLKRSTPHTHAYTCIYGIVMHSYFIHANSSLFPSRDRQPAYSHVWWFMVFSWCVIKIILSLCIHVYTHICGPVPDKYWNRDISNNNAGSLPTNIFEGLASLRTLWVH